MVTLGLGAGLVRAPKTAATPFSPALVSTLAWYDVSNTGSVHHTSNAVTTLDDLSGNARHVGNTGASRPTYNAASGKITFDGTNDCLFHTSPFLSVLSEKTFYAVVNVTAGNYKCLLGEGAASNTSYAPLMTGSGGDNTKLTPYVKADGGTGLLDNKQMGAFTGAKKIIRLHDKNGIMTAWCNGTLMAAARSYVRTGITFTPVKFSLGCLPTDGNSFFAGFDLHEIIIAADDFYGEQYEGYLAHKHGLTADLPAGHRYKTAAPLSGQTTNLTPYLSGPLKAALLGDSLSALNTVDSGAAHSTINSGYFTMYNALAANRMTLPLANNKGVGGDSVSAMVSRMTDLAALDFDVCFFLGGINSVTYGSLPAEVRTQIDDILNYITLTLGKIAVILTITPRVWDTDAATRKQRVLDINAYIMNTHGSRGGRVIAVNIYDDYNNGSDEPVTDATYDGLHPTPYGGFLMGRDIADGLASYFGNAALPDFTTGNLLANGTLTGGSTVATGWTLSTSGPSVTAAKTGEGAQSIVSDYSSTATGNGWNFSQVATSGFTLGDTLYALALVEVEDALNIDELHLELRLQPDSVQTPWRGYGLGGNARPIAETYVSPGQYLIATPPITLTDTDVVSAGAYLHHGVYAASTATYSAVTIKAMGIFKA